jgi:hypothetical protein
MAIDIRRVILTSLLALPCQPACSSSHTGNTATHPAPRTTNSASTTPADQPTNPTAPIPPPRRDVAGRRGDLALGRLYVPDHFSAHATATVDVVVWFLGAPWCVEQTFYDARKNAVLITVTEKKLWETFRDTDALARLLDEAAGWLNREGISDKPIGRVGLGAFSGGYVAVREILNHEQYRDHITDVVLADALYAPRVPGQPDTLDPEAMTPFLDFARRAADGQGTFLFSHLYPPEPQYRNNTTTLAATWLIDRLDVPRQPASTINTRGTRLLYRADRNGFHVFGYAGMTTQDHFDHLYAASDLLKQTSFPDAD